jgi:D-erythrulose 1-phosphate 3-epimerase
MRSINKMYPKVYLAIDNCFASKRWTTPYEWGSVIKDLGLNYIEASADNECDPLYNGAEYLNDWIKKVKDIEEKLDIKVVNLYSGHGTYATLGLGHNNISVHNRMLNRWIKSMIENSSNLSAGLGFFCHAFDQKTLQDKALYYNALDRLYNDFADLSKYASEKGLKIISVEQMYTPHQVPWTIKGAIELLKEIYSRSGQPFYISIDVGHQCCQRQYQMPDYDMIEWYFNKRCEDKWVEKMWLGPELAYQIFNEALFISSLYKDDEIRKIFHIMNEYPYMFADSKDGDTYNWLRELGCFSPIIHLQQTNGKATDHKPFTDIYNKIGIIDGKKILSAIAESYENVKSELLPPVCQEIYLTIEVFSETGAMPVDIVKNLRDTVKYWRQFIPKDGIGLEELVVINEENE